MKRRLLLSFAALVLSTGLSQAAFADSTVIPNFTLTLSNANQSTSQGAPPSGFLSYSGTITNNSANTIFLNGIEFTSTSFGAAGFSPNCTSSTPCIDETPFFNSPFFLTSGASYSGILFNVGVSSTSTIAAFSGFVDILGGSDGSTNTGTSNIVGFSTTVTPEPSSWLLMATGLAGLAIAYRFRPQSAPGMTSL